MILYDNLVENSVIFHETELYENPIFPSRDMPILRLGLLRIIYQFYSFYNGLATYSCVVFAKTVIWTSIAVV